MIRKYEILFLFSQREDIYKDSLKVTKNLFEEIGIKITKEEDMGTKELAYPVKKHTHGHYHVFYVTAESTRIRKLEHELALEEKILRYLVLGIDDNAEKFLFNKEYKHYHHRKAAEYTKQYEEFQKQRELEASHVNAGGRSSGEVEMAGEMAGEVASTYNSKEQQAGTGERIATMDVATKPLSTNTDHTEGTESTENAESGEATGDTTPKTSTTPTGEMNASKMNAGDVEGANLNTASTEGNDSTVKGSH
ncbi:hypothetical protein COTS27_01218 [Spirochaetota bacterium]|nr:hypothetical protein COTS27_01218 [Spirochaetota bacterium]